MALYFAHQLHFGLRETYLFMIYISVLNVIVNAFILGRVSDAIGNRTMSTLGIAALVCGFAFVPFLSTVWQLAIMSAFFSIGMAFGNTGIIALISASADDTLQGTVLSVTSSLDSLSGIVAPPISTELLGAFGSPYSAASSLFFAVIALGLGVRANGREEVSLDKLGHASIPQHDSVSSADTVS
jgi:MFS family permease